MFVVDAFAAAATQYSSDEDTNKNGGLLGEMIQQGVIRSKALDRACFTANLGEVEGPVESEYGWHLVLTPERINCKKDNGYVRIEPRTDGISTPKYIREDNTERAMQGDALGQDGPDRRVLGAVVRLHRRGRGSSWHLAPSCVCVRCSGLGLSSAAPCVCFDLVRQGPRPMLHARSTR